MMVKVLFGLAALFTLFFTVGIVVSWRFWRKEDEGLEPAMLITGLVFVISCVFWLEWANQYDVSENFAQHQKTTQAEATNSR